MGLYAISTRVRTYVRAVDSRVRVEASRPRRRGISEINGSAGNLIRIFVASARDRPSPRSFREYRSLSLPLSLALNRNKPRNALAELLSAARKIGNDRSTLPGTQCRTLNLYQGSPIFPVCRENRSSIVVVKDADASIRNSLLLRETN